MVDLPWQRVRMEAAAGRPIDAEDVLNLLAAHDRLRTKHLPASWNISKGDVFHVDCATPEEAGHMAHYLEPFMNEVGACVLVSVLGSFIPSGKMPVPVLRAMRDKLTELIDE